ncbi:hypothetical protein MMC25_004916 [Agyrium rufum]|nr:hypothetical protein [Agyrium rufum]
MQPWIFTSPASRGIGLELTRKLLSTTKLPVVATARSDVDGTKSRILQGLDVDDKRLQVLQLDVTGKKLAMHSQFPIPISSPIQSEQKSRPEPYESTPEDKLASPLTDIYLSIHPTTDEKSVAAAASHCTAHFPSKSHYLHLAFCIPGILNPEKSPAQIDYAKALETFKVNTLGTLLLVKHFSPFLPRKIVDLSSSLSSSSASSSALPASAVFALMSARVGSITDNAAGGWYSYRASKAGVAQLAKSLDIYLKNTSAEKAMCVALHPGTVKTGLSEDFWKTTPKEKLFEPEFAAESLLGVVRGLRMEDRGRVWDWEGKEIPP